MIANTKERRIEVALFVDDLLKTTDPSRVVDGRRRTNRHGRTLPAVVFPSEDGLPLISEPVLTTTKDLSTGGASLLLQQEFPWSEFVITLPYQQMPVFVSSIVRHRTPLVFGFWQLGVQWLELVEPTVENKLVTVMDKLRRLSSCLED